MARSKAQRWIGLVLLLVGAAAAVLWLRRGDEGSVVPDEESGPPAAGTAALGAPAASMGAATPIAAKGPPAEGIYDPAEVLPEIDVGDRTRVARLPIRRASPGRPETFGKLIVDGILAARDVYLRWDAEETKAKFLRQRFVVPSRLVTEGEVLIYLEPLLPVLRVSGYSARLDGSLLRIGAEGVYPPPPEPEPLPDAERIPDEPPPGPSPR